MKRGKQKMTTVQNLCDVLNDNKRVMISTHVTNTTEYYNADYDLIKREEKILKTIYYGRVADINKNLLDRPVLKLEFGELTNTALIYIS